VSASSPNSPRPRLVIVVAPVPPPLHGAAATTAQILEFLKPRLTIRVANVSPGRATGPWRHIVRIWRTLKGLGLLAARARVPGRTLYMTADGGLGMLYNVAVAGLATLLGYRVFLHHHSFAYIDRRTRRMALLARLLARKGVHVVLCPAMAAGLRAHYRIGRTFELSSAALLPPSTRVQPPPRQVIRMGFLSNLIIEKGLDTSIDLLRAAFAEGLPVELVIAGRAPDRRPLDLIEQAKAEMGDAVVYLGGLTDVEKKAFLDDLDIFLFPSRYFNEAQPRAVLEALAHGLPVLTIARSCIQSDMGEGTGLCAPRHADFVALALPLLRLWSADRAALATVGAAAFERSLLLHRAGQAQLLGLAAALEGTGTP
jgi:glycosyltransferase involved in cell wall biosynthesis